MSQSTTRADRLERRFESLIWKFRLVTLIPVVMSLIGSISCFVLGTYAELSVLYKVAQGEFNSDNSNFLIGKVVGGIDYYLIGIALLILATALRAGDLRHRSAPSHQSPDAAIC